MRVPVAKTVCALALALAGSALATSSAVAGAASNGAISAMNAFSLWNEPASTWGPQLSAQERNGVREVRSDATWADIQPRQPTLGDSGLRWTAYDAWVGALAMHELTWQPIIDYDTSWARASVNPRAFAAFAREIAARYGVGGSFWRAHPELPRLPVRIFEIWNEENVPGRYYVDPWSYGALYALARSAIHTVDPTGSVDLGGLAQSGGENGIADSPAQYVFLLFALHPELKSQIDAFALHPYAPSAAGVIEWVQAFRGALIREAEPSSVPIDLTELGWQFRPQGERWRAEQMKAVGLAFSRSDCGVREAAPYDWINRSGPRGDDFGLVDPSGSSRRLRPAGVAWFTGFAQGSSKGALEVCQ